MSKKGKQGHHPKKELNEQAMAHFNLKQEEKEEPSNRRRLKKLVDINPNEELIENDHTEKMSEEDEEYQQFALKDDEELQQDKINKANKKNKGAQGSHLLDSFLDKRMDKKEKKPK